MVHKVTMDTVKIITSSVSGMTNVSVTHSPAASPLCGAAPCVGPLQLTAWLACSLYPGAPGRMGHAQGSALLLLLFPLSGMSGGAPHLPIA